MTLSVGSTSGTTPSVPELFHDSPGPSAIPSHTGPALLGDGAPGTSIPKSPSPLDLLSNQPKDGLGGSTAGGSGATTNDNQSAHAQPAKDQGDKSVNTGVDLIKDGFSKAGQTVGKSLWHDFWSGSSEGKAPFQILTEGLRLGI